MLRIVLSLVLALFVSASVAMAQAPKKPSPKAKKTAADVFNEKDTNKDGKLTEDEFVGKAKGDQAERAKRVFKAMDADGDGSVTVEEFKTFMEKKKTEKKSPKQ